MKHPEGRERARASTLMRRLERTTKQAHRQAEHLLRHLDTRGIFYQGNLSACLEATRKSNVAITELRVLHSELAEKQKKAKEVRAL